MTACPGKPAQARAEWAWRRSWLAAQERAHLGEPVLGRRLWKAEAHLQGWALARGPEEALGLAGTLGTHRLGACTELPLCGGRGRGRSWVASNSPKGSCRLNNWRAVGRAGGFGLSLAQEPQVAGVVGEGTEGPGKRVKQRAEEAG